MIYNFCDWILIYNISEFEVLFDELCFKFWRYRIVNVLEVFFFNGFYVSYDGGGYVVDFGYNVELVLRVIDDLEKNDWIDFRIIVVFVEFIVYEFLSIFFSVVKYLFERYLIGSFIMNIRIDILKIFYFVDFGFCLIYLVCYFLFIVFFLDCF